jgi:hypothetical protein
MHGGTCDWIRAIKQSFDEFAKFNAKLDQVGCLPKKVISWHLIGANINVIGIHRLLAG